MRMGYSQSKGVRKTMIDDDFLYLLNKSYLSNICKHGGFRTKNKLHNMSCHHYGNSLSLIESHWTNLRIILLHTHTHTHTNVQTRQHIQSGMVLICSADNRRLVKSAQINYANLFLFHFFPNTHVAFLGPMWNASASNSTLTELKWITTRR